MSHAQCLRVIKTACPHDCPDTCSMLATVRVGADGAERLISVEGSARNPYTRGTLCRKVAHYENRVYSSDRVLTPLRRVGRKGAGDFEPISWDEAIETIAATWQRIISESGPEAILPYSYAGTMGVVNMSACDGRLWYRLGASHLDRTICSAAAQAGYTYVNGWCGGIDPESFAGARFIIAWGTNLSSTNVHLMPIVREAQQKGATFVVIDPFRTRTSNAADWFVQVRPGTDAALALGMGCVIFSNGLHNEPFLEAHSIGWQEFRERCREYPPERAAAITGVPEEEIIRLARAYGDEQPSAIRLGYGLSRTGNGGGAVRAICTLPAITGAWSHPGGGLLLSSSAHFPLNKQAVKRPDLQVAPDSQSPVHWGRSRPRVINMNQIGRALLETTDPHVRSLFVYNSNPAAVAPDSNRVLAGLAREDLFTVVHEQMLTDTARFADLVLPATTQMECLDLLTAYGHLYVNLCTPAIRPLGEARANIDVQNAIARAMGFQEEAFQQTAEEIIRAALDAPSPLLEGVTYERLQQEGFARLGRPGEPFEPYAGLGKAQGDGRRWFATPSGKIELFSQSAQSDGFDPLPDYQPAAESAAADPELASRFPINLLSPAGHHFLNSTFANLPDLQDSERLPRIWIHPEDAEARGVVDGDWVRVWNRRGEVRMQAVVSERTGAGAAWTPSLWWHRDSPCGRNVNALTSQALTDMGGGSTFHTNLVQIERTDP